MGPQNYMYLYPPLSNCSEPSRIAKFMLGKINGTIYATICDTSINNKKQAKAKISASHFKVS